MAYIHVEIEQAQSPKKPGAPCGDVVAFERTPSATTLVLCDGLGSGIKANVAATMCASRLLESLRGGGSLRQAFGNLVKNMIRVRGTELPYACFVVVRVLNDGQATVLSYEMPEPLFITTSHASLLPQRTRTVQNALIGESHLQLAPGDSIMVFSDGVTQSGLGLSMRQGWRTEGVRQFLSEQLSQRRPLRELAQAVHDRARELWEGVGGDDVTTALVLARWGKTLSILTGPPSSKSHDRQVASRFLMMEGWKVVAGSTTSEIIAKYLDKELQVQQDLTSKLAPPRYYIEGIDLVTEGAITLNQVYNILGEDAAELEAESGVTELYHLLHAADRINFLVGMARNPAHGDIVFRQRGLLTRGNIVPLLVEKLQGMGKLVTVEYV
ncbi:MAG: SpoIIE family protein phosphatase [Armatimonadota bacterium]